MYNYGVKKQLVSWVILLVSVLCLVLAIVIKSSSCNSNKEEVNTPVREDVSTVSDKINLDNLESYVKLAKVNMKFPEKIDENLQLVDMTAEGESIRYHYEISGVDMSEVTNLDMKNVIMPEICNNPDYAYFFEEEVGLEYSYIVKETSQEIFFSVSKDDCLK